MSGRSLPASPNWYCSCCSDVSSGGLLGVGARNVIYLVEFDSNSCKVSGQLVGHADLVTGFSFCQHAGQDHVCVSSSTDGSVRFWDSNSRSLIREHKAHQTTVSALHWSPQDKNLVVSGDDKGVLVCHWFHTGDSFSLFPEPRSIVCLTCSPHTWSSVAVGYRDGMIVLLDVSRKGEVTHRLRGHDNEIHSLAWSPVLGERSLCDRDYDLDVTNGESRSEDEGCYLASGSKDQTVRIWSTARGKGVMTLKLPFLKRRGSAVDPAVRERIWLSVHWPSGRPTELVSSSFSGELLMWDLTRAGKQRWTLLGSSSDTQNHSRIVFNTSSAQLRDGSELLLSTSMDRDIKCWDLKTLSCCWTLSSLGGAVHALTFSPVASGCLALGVGDSMIRVWNTLSGQNNYDIRSFWQGIKSKVTALSWHPHREGTLAFGTDDGKVGVYEVFSNKPPQICGSYHRKTVYTLAWGPPVPPLSFGASGKPTVSLYSCAGEGVILQHDPSKLSEEAWNIDKLIKDTNNIKHKLSPHTDISWKPDGKVVAIGNEDGCIDVYEAPSLRLLCSIQQHHKIINSLRWYPGQGSYPELHALLASGSSNAIVFVHDLRSILETPPQTPVVLTEPFRRLCGHTAKITGMAWSPHHGARLVTASYDGTAQVWDVLEEAPISNFRGHVGYLLSVDWSPVDPDVVWTGGKDFTVQEWKVSAQEFTKPPKGKKMAVLQERKKGGSKQKKNKVAPGAGGDAWPKMNGEKAVAEVEQREEEEDQEGDEAGSTGSADPAGVAMEMHRKSSVSTPLVPAGAATTATAAKSRDKLDALKRKKPRSLLPLSTSMDHRPKDEQLQDVELLTALAHGTAPPAGCEPGRERHVHLGLFADRQALYRMLEAEEDSHIQAGHFDSVVYLRLWSGDLQGALQLATERGELNDHLLSVAPMAGFQVWAQTVEAYVRQLSVQEQYLKASSHLLSLGRVHEAVELLRSHRLFREAIALAKARLPPDDPVLQELYLGWGAQLEKDGHLSAAAKCYVAAGSSFDAAKVISKKSDPPSLRTAAAVARLCGAGALARTLALRCAKELAAAQEWEEAQEVLKHQDELLAHRLHLCVAELLTVALRDARVVRVPAGYSSHPWAAGTSSGLLQDRVLEVWQQEFGIPSDRTEGGEAVEVEALLQELQSVETPPPTASIPHREVLFPPALLLTRALLSWLNQDTVRTAQELWRAGVWLRDGGLFCASAELCRLMFPEGDISVFSGKSERSLKSLGSEEDPTTEAPVSSLQALVSYHRLYQQWWARKQVSERPGQLELLLSEPHAVCQSVHRSMQALRERLSAMVLKHSRTQEEEEEEAEQSSEDPETLVSLSAKMSDLQQQLDGLPDCVKSYPRPDVLECCLLLLHLARCFASVPPSLQQTAKDLLLKFGTSPAVQKSSQRFLT